MKELSKLLSSFNLRCGLYLSADMSSQPMAVYMKELDNLLSSFILRCGSKPGS